MNTYKFTNNLINEKSPYLLQHAHNPVNWYPWSSEAFKKAKEENKPIFLSIGYSTCHWCHVMERESFEDEKVAKKLNEHFISIKVDREERPDIDSIYMNVCVALTGSGGWPLSIFLTPDMKPFFAGTYFPKNSYMGMPGFVTLLEKIDFSWKNNRNDLINAGNEILDTLRSKRYEIDSNIPNESPDEAFNGLSHIFDEEYGGFGYAPKFPTPHNLFFLLRYWHSAKNTKALEIVEKTLDSMYRGGIFDHIGYGFSRYSTDRKWLAPHFEKMLYDNALISLAYVEGYQALKKERYADVANKIFEYILRDMTSPEGAFYCAEDADSEGHEGKFYVWTPQEIKDVLGKENGDLFCRYFDITGQGNFEGKNIPNLINTQIQNNDIELVEECRKKLFNHREKRVHPFKDDKILSSWNGLMIASLARGGKILKNEKYILSAEKAINFVLSKLVREDGRLMARFRDNEVSHPAYLEDYAFIIWGLIELYETTFKSKYLKKAIDLSFKVNELFRDEEHGGFFLYGKDAEQLILRPKESHDNVVPSGNSAMAMNFLRLSRLTGKSEFEEKAMEQFKFFGKNSETITKGI